MATFSEQRFRCFLLLLRQLGSCTSISDIRISIAKGLSVTEILAPPWRRLAETNLATYQQFDLSDLIFTRLNTQCLVVFQRDCVKIVLYLLLFSVIIPCLNVKMTRCPVFGCSNDSKQGKDHTYHKFPSDKTLKSKWSSAMKRKGFMPTQHSRVCSAHFQSDDYETLEYHASHLKYS